MNFQILTYENHTTLKWVYLENDVPMEYKKIQLDFHNNTFLTLIDTWTLYSVGNFSRISANQAVQVGRAAAKKLDLSIVENDSTITKPELSDSIYDVSLSMVPGNILNANPPEAPSSNIPSKVARDPLALYPLWQLHFYFTEKVGDILGIEVGVWGDSEEIAYCEDFGLLGISELSGSQTAPPSTPVITPSASQKLEIPEVQTMDEQNNPNYLNQILLATVSLTALSIAISLFALRKKNKRK